MLSLFFDRCASCVEYSREKWTNSREMGERKRTGLDFPWFAQSDGWLPSSETCAHRSRPSSSDDDAQAPVFVPVWVLDFYSFVLVLKPPIERTGNSLLEWAGYFRRIMTIFWLSRCRMFHSFMGWSDERWERRQRRRMLICFGLRADITLKSPFFRHISLDLFFSPSLYSRFLFASLYPYSFRTFKNVPIYLSGCRHCQLWVVARRPVLRPVLRPTTTTTAPRRLRSLGPIWLRLTKLGLFLDARLLVLFATVSRSAWSSLTIPALYGFLLLF